MIQQAIHLNSKRNKEIANEIVWSSSGSGAFSSPNSVEAIKNGYNDHYYII